MSRIDKSPGAGPVDLIRGMCLFNLAIFASWREQVPSMNLAIPPGEPLLLRTTGISFGHNSPSGAEGAGGKGVGDKRIEPFWRKWRPIKESGG